MNKVIQLGGSAAFIPTFENAAYGIEWTKDDNDIIRIGNAKFHRELPIQNRLKGCVYNEKKISYFLNPTGWAKPLENGLIPHLILDLVLILFLIKLELIKKLTIIGKEVMMDKIQIKLFVCFCLAVTLVTVLRLALVAFILFGFGRIPLLRSASLPQLSLIK